MAVEMVKVTGAVRKSLKCRLGPCWLEWRRVKAVDFTGSSVVVINGLGKK